MPDAVGFEVSSARFNDAANEVSSAMGVYGLSSMVFALLLAFYTSRFKINRRWIHAVSMAIGGMGFAGMLALDPATSSNLGWCFACIGIAWGSILSMPYAMLSSTIVPEKMGIYMGVFNMFIVLPQIVAALGGITWLNDLFYSGEISGTMQLAGWSCLLSGITVMFVSKEVG